MYWFERRNKGVFLAATPIDVSQILRERLFEAVRHSDSDFGDSNRWRPLRVHPASHGRWTTLQELQLPPEFDYEQQALLYLPQRMPDVRDAGFAAKAADEIVGLLETQPGPRVLPVHQLCANE